MANLTSTIVYGNLDVKKYATIEKNLLVNGNISVGGNINATSITGNLNGKASSAGTADNAIAIRTVTRATNANHYLTFVDSDNSSAAYESLYTDGGVYFNPSNDTLFVKNLSITTGGSITGSVIGNADTSTSSSYPTGFNSRLTTATWGNQDGTVITDWHTTAGGDIAFRENSGQINVVTDGYFYQNEGQYKVLDTSNVASTYSSTGTDPVNGVAVAAALGSYLPLSAGDGKSLTGNLYITANSTTTTAGIQNFIQGTVSTNDYWRIGGGNSSASTNVGYMEIATADDATEPIYVRQYSGLFATLSRTLTLLDASGYTSIPSRLGIGKTTAPTKALDVNGNADIGGTLDVTGKTTGTTAEFTTSITSPTGNITTVNSTTGNITTVNSTTVNTPRINMNSTTQYIYYNSVTGSIDIVC